MIHARNRQTGSLKPHPEAVLGLAQLASKQPAAQTSGVSAVPTSFNSLNWSGVANSNTLKKWNANSSFNRIYSEFNVPVVEQTFEVCGPLEWEVTWNGIDGALNGTVLQGGSSSQASCSSNVQTQNYYAWVEWYPSYPMVEVFAVNPGDDIYVNTYSSGGGCNPGFVFIEDETLLAYGTYQLNWQTGPCLVGNTAEIIVERPFGANNLTGWYPLANYIWDFALSWDYTAKGTEFGPGATSPSTLVFTMFDDQEDQPISIPNQEGKYSMFFWDTNCAYTGGCAP
jgi:Peptidase A4 family